MREIKFRGFRNFGGNVLYPPDKRWVYGYYSFRDGKHWINDIDDWKMTYMVEDGSVGQFIGLSDKQKVELYEGDIVREYRVPLGCGSQEKWDELSKEVRRVSPVVWCNDELTFVVDGTRIGVLNGWGNLEVIGNTYENKELL